MVDIDAAIGFVVARGDGLDRARLSHLRTGAVPSDEVYDQIERGQLASGGWPAKPGDPVASVDATCFRLAELDSLSGLHRPAAREALRWLVSRQRPDGCWEEDIALAHDAPPWATPGDPEARFYLTATAAFWLCLADADGREQDLGTRSPWADPIDRAADALREQVTAVGGWPGFLASGWLAGTVLHRTGWFYEAARIFVALGERVRTMAAADAAALAATLRRAGFGADESLVVAARERLSQTQRPDGAWPSGDDDIAFDVQTTLTALRALR
jgi:hypothetical protein